MEGKAGQAGQTVAVFSEALVLAHRLARLFFLFFFLLLPFKERERGKE